MAAIDLDDDLTIQESPWRGRIVTLGVLAIIAAAIAAGLYFFYFKSDSTTLTRATEDLPVKRSTINQTVIISGVADAQFNSNLIFQASGKVATVNVKVGDAVNQGDVLASLESDDLFNGVASAQANQKSAQLKLDDLLAGSTGAELAVADQALASAQAVLTKGQNDYDDLVNGGSTSEKSAAAQAVSAASAQVSSAKAAREKLKDAPSAADKAAAQAGVAQAQSALIAAQNSSASAQNSVTSAIASLKSAEEAYCTPDPAPDPAAAFCTSQTAPISAADTTAMNSALATAHATEASGVIGANSAYLNAVNAASSAAAGVTSAQQALDAAQAKLNAANEGAKSADVAAADAAITSAETALTAATDKLNSVNQGGTELQISSAKAAADSAFAALAAAQAKRDEAYRGPKANTIDQARAAVRSAALTVEAAQIRLKNAQIIAPFDGVVGAVNAKPGEFFAAASAAGAAIVLLTPDQITLKMDVGETDYAKLKKGQGGGVLFDSIPGKIYPFAISEIGLSPSVTQGVVTYKVKASLVLPPDAPRPAPGMNARGQIITESKPNVLVVPPRAIRRSGKDQVVDVRRNGSVVEQIVTTGATDPAQVEILTGLNDGDVAVVPALTTARPGSTPKAQPTLPGGVK